MSYQSNGTGRVVQESYDDDSAAITGSLLPGSNINKGASNSARGEGTTTAELVSKLRFLNCGACLVIILFHTLKIFLNPIRLTLLLSSPMKLIMELIVGILALCLFLVEARIPSLGDKVLLLMRKFSVGRFQCIDLNVARGRAVALVIIGVSMGLINYLNHDGFSSSKSGGNSVSDEMDIPSDTNSTDFENVDTTTTSANDASTSMLFIIIQCLVFSPTIWIVFTLAAYTIYIMHTFPDFAQEIAYSLPDGSNTAASTSSSGPSWVSNVGEVVQGSGYQTLNV